jgi:ribokinase
MPTQTLTQVEKASEALKQKGIKNIVVTMGEKGVFWFGQQDRLLVPAIAVNALDTTAAGDAFIGGFATALAEGAALPDALSFGNAAGAIAVTKKGAQSSLPDRTEVEHSLKIEARKSKL